MKGHRKLLRTMSLLVGFWALTSCQSATMSDDVMDLTKWRQQVDRTKVPAKLFPEAVEVDLYAAKLSIRVMDGGKVVSSEVGRDGKIAEVPTGEGVRLTSNEVDSLRHAVFYAPPAPIGAACCIPRHAFVFYGANGQYLGNLVVCFECYCAFIRPDELSTRNMEVLWDRRAIGKIVEAHGLPVKYGWSPFTD